jgi:F-type H+-transporting ATPase subunit alpha
LLRELRGPGAAILATIRTEKAISADTEKKLKTFMEEFAAAFA